MTAGIQPAHYTKTNWILPGNIRYCRVVVLKLWENVTSKSVGMIFSSDAVPRLRPWGEIVNIFWLPGGLGGVGSPEECWKNFPWLETSENSNWNQSRLPLWLWLELSAITLLDAPGKFSSWISFVANVHVLFVFSKQFLYIRLLWV